MTTTTTTAAPAGPALLRSVPTAATPSPQAARATTPGAEDTAAERVARCARAADDAAAMAEHAVMQLRTVRSALLGGHRGSADETTARVMTELGALAQVLGELHGELDELAATDGPEGA